MLSTILTITCTLLFLTADAAKIPKEWKLCKNDANLSKCLKLSLESAIPQFVKGVPSLGIYAIDPLHFEKLIIGKGNGPVSLDLSFHNFDIIGLKNLKLKTFESDWKTMKTKVLVPKVTIKGGYKVNGKVLVLPVTGDGDCLLELINLTSDAVIHISTITKDNKKYYNIDKIDLPLAIDKLTLKMNNLFNGDKKLGDQMNIFLNENWQEIFKELQPAISEAVSTAFIEIGNRVFSKVPKDQITPP